MKLTSRITPKALGKERNISLRAISYFILQYHVDVIFSEKSKLTKYLKRPHLITPIVVNRSKDDVKHDPQHLKPESNNILWHLHLYFSSETTHSVTNVSECFTNTMT